MNIYERLTRYILGLFLITVGIAFSIKSNLGSSPVSTIPYTLTVVWGVEIGQATILFQSTLVLIQIILLRRKFQLRNLGQIIVGILFGYFTSFSVYLLSFIPESNSIIISLIYMAISIVLIALGLFTYLPPNLIPLSVEGVTQTIALVTKQPFPKIKVGFDTTVVALSLITCLVMIKSPGSVGVGTVISAILVGSVLKYIVKIFEHFKGYNPLVVK
ncbi:YczE/YyaS/YitT family protein [Methanosphaera sp.]